MGKTFEEFSAEIGAQIGPLPQSLADSALGIAIASGHIVFDQTDQGCLVVGVDCISEPNARLMLSSCDLLGNVSALLVLLDFAESSTPVVRIASSTPGEGIAHIAAYRLSSCGCSSSDRAAILRDWVEQTAASSLAYGGDIATQRSAAIAAMMDEVPSRPSIAQYRRFCQIHDLAPAHNRDMLDSIPATTFDKIGAVEQARDLYETRLRVQLFRRFAAAARVRLRSGSVTRSRYDSLVRRFGLDAKSDEECRRLYYQNMWLAGGVPRAVNITPTMWAALRGINVS